MRIDPPPRAARAVGLDIGSNTISCVELHKKDGEIEIVKDMSIPVRLSEDLKRDGTLKPTAVARGLVALERIVEAFNPEQKALRAVGTAVFRLARDPEVFLAPAKDIIGQEVEVLTGEAEATLMGRSAGFGVEGEGAIISVDVGGQSTELCCLEGSEIKAAVSLKLGVVSLTDRYATSDTLTQSKIEPMRRYIQSVLAGAIETGGAGRVIGVAGTATTLARLVLGMGKWDRKQVHGLVVNRSEVRGWLDRMRTLTSQERASKWGISPLRADVFPAGLLIFDCLLEHFENDALMISANGLRFGVALNLLEA